MEAGGAVGIRSPSPADSDGNQSAGRRKASGRHPTLATILVHLIAETHRHAGHVDILREQLDGRAGVHPDFDNLTDVEPGWWESFVERLEQTARKFK